jgi:hypothetical protein
MVEAMVAELRGGHGDSASILSTKDSTAE